MIEREQQAVAHTTAIPLTLPRSLVINETLLARLILVLALAAGAFLRIWQINAMGYNTDEAVYAGQAAAIAGVEGLKEIFPVFRAHPLLFQFGLSIIYHFNFNDLWGRLLAAAIGLGTIYLSYRLGRLMYSELAGALAAAFMALMPYHVLVSRQVLLDGPMTFFATLALLLLAKFGRSGRGVWLAASGAAMGLTFLSKETGIVLVGAIYAFLALAPELRVRLRTLLLSPR
jgi:4-amino-4-deoxy-L-arabinose transferase-like glycosyltransferase